MKIEISSQLMPQVILLAARFVFRELRHPPTKELSKLLETHPNRVLRLENSVSSGSGSVTLLPNRVNRVKNPIPTPDQATVPAGIDYPPEIPRIVASHIEDHPKKVVETKKLGEFEFPGSQQENKALAVPTGCIPCALGHYGTCSGVLNEAVRFAGDGLGNDEVVNRVNMCLDELNAMERVDLRPEMITQLSGWEKELAEKALVTSRQIRHGLESLANNGKKEDLEKLAATMQSTRQDIGRTWFKTKLQNMTPEEKVEMQQRIMQKLTENGGEETQ